MHKLTSNPKVQNYLFYWNIIILSTNIHFAPFVSFLPIKEKSETKMKSAKKMVQLFTKKGKLVQLHEHYNINKV